MKKAFIGILFIIAGCIIPGICIVKSIRFSQECGGYLEQTANANTAELALERISIAIDYIEANRLTEGYTSVLWKTEDENIGYWYRNIKACQSELEGCLDATQLEKSNVLMKVRESLTYDGKDGDKLIIPAGISRYPDNELLGWLRLVSYILIIVGLVEVCLAFEEWC